MIFHNMTKGKGSKHIFCYMCRKEFYDKEVFENHKPYR